ncbi:MAG TPA: hypothetical protein VGB73_04780 [Pyrinomonadaceae bacterium]|jgi:hypothetical protein
MALSILAAALPAIGQTRQAQPQPPPATKTEQASPKTAGTTAKPKGIWNLTVTKKTPRLISLKATDAPLTEIASELSRKVGVPVNLSPLMSKQRMTLEFSNLPLDAALRMLAPQPYVDYEVSGDFNLQPKPLALYLHGLNEPPPAANAGIKSNSVALLIEGDTEEGTEEYEKRKEQEETVLSVSYSKNQLSVLAKKQPLSVVLYKIAAELGIPFDLNYESREVVDVNFNNYSVEQALRSISPLVRFYFRADLQTSEIKPLRIALVPTAKT